MCQHPTINLIIMYCKHVQIKILKIYEAHPYPELPTVWHNPPLSSRNVWLTEISKHSVYPNAGINENKWFKRLLLFSSSSWGLLARRFWRFCDVNKWGAGVRVTKSPWKCQMTLDQSSSRPKIFAPEKAFRNISISKLTITFIVNLCFFFLCFSCL